MPANPQQEILLPVKPGFMALTLMVGFFLNLLPLTGFFQWIRPDFVAILLLYWCINQPLRMGIGTAWVFGILMDVSDAALLGQHAAAYSIMAFLGLALRRRVRMFSLWQQVLHVMPMLFVAQVVYALIGLSKGAFYGWPYFIGSLTTAILWPLLTFLLKLPQRTKSDPDRI